MATKTVLGEKIALTYTSDLRKGIGYVSPAMPLRGEAFKTLKILLMEIRTFLLSVMLALFSDYTGFCEEKPEDE